jgi:hypothetical protein
MTIVALDPTTGLERSRYVPHSPAEVDAALDAAAEIETCAVTGEHVKTLWIGPESAA